MVPPKLTLAVSVLDSVVGPLAGVSACGAPPQKKNLSQDSSVPSTTKFLVLVPAPKSSTQRANMHFLLLLTESCYVFQADPKYLSLSIFLLLPPHIRNYRNTLLCYTQNYV